MEKRIKILIRNVLVLILNGLRGSFLISRGTCRFEPTCSSYADESLRIHSLPRALWLIIRRLVRCHPFSAGGYDPVPSGRKIP